MKIRNGQVLGIFLFLAGIIGVYGFMVVKDSGLSSYDYASIIVFGIGLIAWGIMPKDVRIGSSKG